MRLFTLFFALTIVLFSPTTFAQNENAATVQYYPGTTGRLPIGTEEYLKNHASLAGIEGVYVLLDYVEGSSKKNGIIIGNDLESQIKKKLNAVGLKYLTKDEMDVTPGKPELAIYPSYSGGSIAAKNSDALVAKGASAANNCGLGQNACCRNSIWMSFMQSATILRRPDSQFKFGTWGAGDDSNWCEDRGQWMYDATLNVIDLFVEDYKKAESEKKPIQVANDSEVPINCAQVWALHIQVFDTDATRPNTTFLPILNKLSTQAQRCSNYSYLIETHADSRSNERYNKLLTEARAASIKEHLMGLGVEYNRLKSLAHGESKPLTTGNTAADHATNRRVIITPVLADQFVAIVEE